MTRRSLAIAIAIAIAAVAILLLPPLLATFAFFGITSADDLVSVTNGIAVFSVIVAVLQIFARRRVRRSLPASDGLRWLRFSPGGNRRHLLQTCMSVDSLVDCLLNRAVEKLPDASRARFAEEWHDHRQHYSGWRLLWWALCVRATAFRTVTAIEPAQLPRDT